MVFLKNIEKARGEIKPRMSANQRYSVVFLHLFASMSGSFSSSFVWNAILVLA